MWKKIIQEQKNTFRIKKNGNDDRFGCSGVFVRIAVFEVRAELCSNVCRIKADIKIDITNTFEQIVISENGKISMFSKVAENMMADYVQSIQIAPDGI